MKQAWLLCILLYCFYSDAEVTKPKSKIVRVANTCGLFFVNIAKLNHNYFQSTYRSPFLLASILKDPHAQYIDQKLFGLISKVGADQDNRSKVKRSFERFLLEFSRPLAMDLKNSPQSTWQITPLNGPIHALTKKISQSIKEGEKHSLSAFMQNPKVLTLPADLILYSYVYYLTFQDTPLDPFYLFHSALEKGTKMVTEWKDKKQLLLLIDQDRRYQKIKLRMQKGKISEEQALSEAKELTMQLLNDYLLIVQNILMQDPDPEKEMENKLLRLQLLETKTFQDLNTIFSQKLGDSFREPYFSFKNPKDKEIRFDSEKALPYIDKIIRMRCYNHISFSMISSLYVEGKNSAVIKELEQEKFAPFKEYIHKELNREEVKEIEAKVKTQNKAAAVQKWMEVKSRLQIFDFLGVTPMIPADRTPDKISRPYDLNDLKQEIINEYK